MGAARPQCLCVRDVYIEHSDGLSQRDAVDECRRELRPVGRNVLRTPSRNRL